jgi:hypothetical protein
MPEELYLNFKFRNRKSGELYDGYFKIPDVEKYTAGFKKFFNIHEYRICERRIVTKEEFERRGKPKEKAGEF